MSELSENYLSTTDERVHREFDLLVSAYYYYENVYTTDLFFNKDLKNQDVKEWLASKLKSFGHTDSPEENERLLEVFELYLAFYMDYIFPQWKKIPIDKTVLGPMIFGLAADYLDRQFSTENRADIRFFLKTPPDENLIIEFLEKAAKAPYM